VSDFNLGLVLVAIAASANAAFALPMKYARRWEWENIWLAWTLFALLLLPFAAARASIPLLGAVYREAGAAPILAVMLCGAGWGCAQVLFGLCIDAIGVGLAFSIVLGVSAAVGSLIPLLHQQHSYTPNGQLWSIAPGISLVLLGVLVCAAAGRAREKAQSGLVKTSKPFAVGLAMALLSGFCAAFMNVGVAYGAPLAMSAAAHGAGAQHVVNAIWLPLLAAGAVPNLVYCWYLLLKQGSWKNYRSPDTPFYAFLAAVMAILWFFSTALYGTATGLLGNLGVVLGWPAFMSLIVLMAGFLGLLTGEWKHAGTKPILLQIAGMVILVLAVIALSQARTATGDGAANSGELRETGAAHVR
jgi:L-rhamnose-H+ transport protein